MDKRISLILLLALWLWGTELRVAAQGETRRISVTTGGQQANGISYQPAISDDGRWVLFTSLATNLVAADTNDVSDIFLHDRDRDGNGVLDESGGVRTSRINVGMNGVEADGASEQPAISGDGRYLAFASDATNLVPGDTNGQRDIFVVDRQTGHTARVSVGSDGAQSNGPAGAPTLSLTGRFVAFVSLADNLIVGDNNGVPDIYLHDRDADGNGILDETGGITTERVSVGLNGAESNGASAAPILSATGHEVAFIAQATNLGPDGLGDTADFHWNVFVYQRSRQRTLRISRSWNHAPVDGNSGDGLDYRFGFSPDGRFVTFSSAAGNLVDGDTNNQQDIFLYDRDADGNGVLDESFSGGYTTLARISLGSDGEADGDSRQAAISADGRYVVFQSMAENLLNQPNNFAQDIFRYDRLSKQLTQLSRPAFGSAPNGAAYDPVISGDGAAVLFLSAATNLVTGDTNGVEDLFLVQDEPAAPPVATPWQQQSLDLRGDAGFYVTLALDDYSRPHLLYGRHDETGNTLHYLAWDGIAWQERLMQPMPAQLHQQRQPDTYGAGLAFDDKDRPHLAFLVAANASQLRYDHWDGTQWQPAVIEVPTPLTFGHRPTPLVIAADGPHLLATIIENDTRQLTHLHRSADGAWQQQRLGPSDQRYALALTTAGAPAAAYYDQGAQTVQLARWTGNAWQRSPVPSGSAVGAVHGLAFDQGNRAHLLFTQANQWYYGVQTDDEWQVEQVAITPEGQVALALDNEDAPLLLLADTLTRDRRLYQRTAAGWSSQPIPESVTPRGSSSQSDKGFANALAVDRSGQLHVAYNDSFYGDLFYSVPGAAWQQRTIYSDGVNAWPQLALRAGLPAISFSSSNGPATFLSDWQASAWATTPFPVGAPGYQAPLWYDSRERPHLAYYDATTRQLRLAVQSSGVWSTTVVAELHPALHLGPRIEVIPDASGDNSSLLYSLANDGAASLRLSWRAAPVATWQHLSLPLLGVTTPITTFSGARAGNGNVVVVYTMADVAYRVAHDGHSWGEMIRLPAVDQATALALVIESRLVREHNDAAVIDTTTLAYARRDSHVITYTVEGQGVYTAPVAGPVQELALHHATGSWQRPRLAYIGTDNGVYFLSAHLPLPATWSSTTVTPPGTTPRGHLSFVLGDRERLAYREQIREGRVDIVHAWRTVTSEAAVQQTIKRQGYMVPLVKGGCLCLFAGINGCNPLLTQASSSVRGATGIDLGGALVVGDEAVLQALTNYFAATPTGYAFVDTYLRHDHEIMSIVVSDPALLQHSYRALHNFLPGLTALVNGRGAEVTLTQAMIDQALTGWQAVAAQASPALAAEIHSRLTTTNNLQSYVGLTFDQWAQALGVGAAPSRQNFLPLIMQYLHRPPVDD